MLLDHADLELSVLRCLKCFISRARCEGLGNLDFRDELVLFREFREQRVPFNTVIPLEKAFVAFSEKLSFAFTILQTKPEFISLER